MAVTAENIKELRNLTSCGVIECKKALEEAEGDIEKAKEVLKKRGLEIAAKKGSRTASEGRIEAYIHAGGKIGVLVDLACETDFVAQNDDFADLARNLAMHIAAFAPKYTKRDDVPAEDLQGIEISEEEYYKQYCLVEQPFIKDGSKNVGDVINGLIASIGENIYVNRFLRYKVNEVE